VWNVYLLGQLGKDGVPGRRFPEYFPVAWLYKVPIAAQLLFLAAIVSYLRRWRRFDFRRNEWILLCPILFFVPYFILIFRTQVGLRYSLMLFPLIYVFTGSLLARPLPRARWRTPALIILCAYLVISVLSYYPHYLPYFNELLRDRRQAYKILADSNLDWGQSERYLHRWRKAHPEAIYQPDRPMPGTLIVPVNWLVGVFAPERNRWLRENFEPDEHIAHAYLVYRITPQDLERIANAAGRKP
jgi:hypothetical protein